LTQVRKKGGRKYVGIMNLLRGPGPRHQEK